MSAEANPREPVAVDHDFKAVVEESKAAIAAQEIVPPKRGRGRPKKDGAASVPRAQSLDTANVVPSAPPPDIATYLEFPLIALSKGPAKKHDLPDLALTPDEAKACAQALQACLNAFLPDVNNMSPKTAAIVGLLMTCGSIGFTKYQLLAEKQVEDAKKAPPPAEPTFQEKNEAAGVGIDAHSYFSR